MVVMVSASTLYQGDAPERIRWALNAVIIGAMLTEIVVRILERRRNTAELTPIPPTHPPAETVFPNKPTTVAGPIVTTDEAPPPSSPPDAAREETST